MQKIRRVGSISLARIMAVIYGCFGVMVGGFIALFKLLGIEPGGDAAQLQAVGYAAVIIFPLVYAIIGAISGLISGFLFNKAADWIGPLEVTIVQSQE